MAYNATEYLSEFLLYHLRLVDHIYLIDHKSDYDLRELNISDVTILRSNQIAQFQSECTNLVIDHFNIKKNFDWLFVLDVDEFLPFTSKTVFYRFLESHKTKKVIRFYWKNGIPLNDEKSTQPESIIDSMSVLFYSKNNFNYKSFVNIKKLGENFVVPTGAHHIAMARKTWIYSLPYFRNKSIYRSYPVGKPLYHIVSTNKKSFIRKIQNYVEQMKYRAHVKGQGGWMVRDYPLEMTDDQWLWYVANFRVTNPSFHQPADRSDFHLVSILEHLDVKRVYSLRAQIKALQKKETPKQSQEEKLYLAQKEDDTKIIENISWFAIDERLEIKSIVPK